MTDITSMNLEAAFIDQKVAGAFRGMAYAFVAVMDKDGWAMGVAVANEDGFSPLKGKTFKTHDEASEWADGLNEHIGLTADDSFKIVASTMGGQRYEKYIGPSHWGQA